MTISKCSGAGRLALAIFCLLILLPGTVLAQAGDQRANQPRQAPPAQAPQAPRTGDDQMLKPNLDNVGLKDFIRFVSRFTGRNIVYREDVIPNVKVSVFSQDPITEPDLMAMFHEVLASANLAAIARGDVLYILPEKQSRDLEHTFAPQAGRGPQEELLTTVYRVSGGMTAKAAEAVLKPVASPFGVVLSIPQASAVLIKDTRSRINNMVKLIRSLETIQPRWRVEHFRLERAKAESVARKLGEFYKQMVDHGREAEPPLLLPVEWANYLIVAGDPEQIENTRSLVMRMDYVGEGTSGLKVYRLQNAKAESAVKVLEGLLTSIKAGGGGGGGAAAGQQGQQGQAAAPSQSAQFQVSADTNTNSIVVMGDSEFIAKVDQIIAQLDQPLDQVYVQALIMETSLDNTNQFGVEWLVGGGNNNYAAFGGFINNPNSSLLGFSTPVLNNQSPAFTALPGGFNLGVMGNVITFGGVRFPTLSALINFLKTADGVNILSTPQIMTLDNAQAEVFVGENRPYLTSARTDTANANPNLTTQLYDYRDVGVRLKVVPHINGQTGLIRLDLEQEVKKVSGQANTTQPITLNRTTKTSVQLLEGSTLVISGLIQNDNTLNRRGVPGLGDVPGLGWLFKSKSDSYQRATLMIFITARIIRTQDQADALTKAKLGESESARRDAHDSVVKEFGGRSVLDDGVPKGLDPAPIIESFESKPGEGFGPGAGPAAPSTGIPSGPPAGIPVAPLPGAAGSYPGTSGGTLPPPPPGMVVPPTGSSGVVTTPPASAYQ